MFPRTRVRPIDQKVTRSFCYGELEITYTYTPSEDPDPSTGYPGCEADYELQRIMVGGIDILAEIEGLCQTKYNDVLESMCHDNHIATLPDETNHDDEPRY